MLDASMTLFISISMAQSGENISESLALLLLSGTDNELARKAQYFASAHPNTTFHTFQSKKVRNSLFLMRRGTMMSTCVGWRQCLKTTESLALH